MRNKRPLTQTAAWPLLEADQILGIVGMYTYLCAAVASQQGGGCDVQDAAATMPLWCNASRHLHASTYTLTRTCTVEPDRRGSSILAHKRLFCLDAGVLGVGMDEGVGVRLRTPLPLFGEWQVPEALSSFISPLVFVYNE